MKNQFLPYKTKKLTSVIQDVEVKSGTVTGYFAAFSNIDSDNDMIIQGAFAKTIRELGPLGKNRIMHLLQHDRYQVLGKPTILKEDNRGLYFETTIVPTTFGLDTLKLYEARVYNEHSIGYNTIKSEKILKPDANPDFYDSYYYKLVELRLWEGSTVTFGANEETPFTGLKSLSKTDRATKINERIDKLVKASKIGDLTDDAYILLELEQVQLKSLIISFIEEEDQKASTPEPNKITLIEPPTIVQPITKSNEIDYERLLNNLNLISI